jgi:hypothetical protein
LTADLAGRQLQGGKYQLQQLLAEGGMAAVWSAQMPSLDTLVAVKVLSPALAESHSVSSSKPKRNASLICTIPIIEVHDCEAEGGLLYIAMRFVRGRSLADYMNKLDGPMDLSLAAKLRADQQQPQLVDHGGLPGVCGDRRFPAVPRVAARRRRWFRKDDRQSA